MKKLLLGLILAFVISNPAFAVIKNGSNGGGSGGGSVSVTAGTPDIVINPSPGTGTFTVGLTQPINAQTGTSYTVLSTDMGKTVTQSNASSSAYTLPQAGTTGFETGKSFSLINLGAGTATITPTTSTINGASSLALTQYQSSYNISDGTNWIAFLGAASGSGGTITLGTSASATNPQRSGQAGTGLFSASSNVVSIAANGTDTVDIGTTGVSLAANSFAYNVNGATGLAFNTADSGTAGSSLAIGPGSLSGQTSSAAYGSTAVGYQALHGTMTTAALKNTAIGYQAGTAITTGKENTYVGYQAGSTNTGGNDDVAIGQGTIAAGNNTVAIGQGCNAGASGAICIGSFGTAAKLGNSIAIGVGTLVGFTSGSNSIAIGAGAATVGDNGVIIGPNAGNTSISGAGNVVIGNTVGHTTLTTGANNILVGVSSAIDTAASSTSNTINIGGTGGSWVLVTGTGTVSTESTTMRGTLTLSDIASDATHTDATVCEDTTTHTFYAGSGTAGICLGTSSARYKEDIVGMTDGLASVLSLKPVNFFYKRGHGDNGAKEQFGFLAEDMVTTLPKLVGLDSAGLPNSVDILGVVPVLVKAMQEQQQEIEHIRIVSNDPCKAFNSFGRWIVGCR